jgi:hypothetical protein
VRIPLVPLSEGNYQNLKKEMAKVSEFSVV